MSFYNTTPLKHGKGVNKPFRSPLIKSDQNDTPKRLNTPSKLNQNSRFKSLGLKSSNFRGFNSPLKPLVVSTPPLKSLETETLVKCLDHSAPLKRIENNILLIRSKNNLMKILQDNVSSVQPENNVNRKPIQNDSPVKLKESCSDLKTKYSSTNVTSVNKILTVEEKVSLEIKENPSHKRELLKTPPISPKIVQPMESPEYQPVVKLQRLNSKIIDLNKMDLALLIKRISDKQRQMVELRAKQPVTRKHNLEEIVMSIGKWRDAFVEALETLRISLTEKNGRSFSTIDVLKILSIPNNIVHFSEEHNDFIFPKI